MSIRLIVNADDYGCSSEVSRGIREAHSKGIVSSTTCMMNFVTIDDDIALALKETPDLGLGVHLVLTAGNPLLPPGQIPTLTAADGAFLTYEPLLQACAQIDAAQLKSEWRAQIEKFIHLAGRKPTHLDSHHHVAFWSETLFRTMLELATEYGCAIRQIAAQPPGVRAGLSGAAFDEVDNFMPCLLAEFSLPVPDLFYVTFYDEMATKENLLNIIHALPPDGVHELMCHPGYADAYLFGSTVYARQREKELAILTNGEITQAIIDRNIQLVTFTAV